MRLNWAGLLLLVVAAAGPPARAEMGTIDNVPAATLLLPYFEVDLDNTNGINTVFSMGNASDSAVLTQVSLWSDLGVPSRVVNVYLRPRDVQTVDLRALFVDGTPPQTQQVGVLFPNCGSLLPPPLYTPTQISTIQAIHTGVVVPSVGRCYGVNRGDRIARGYVTIDSVNACATFTPADAGYFSSGGFGIANNANVLWGDWALVDPGNNFAQGDNLVAIEAQTGFFVPGDYTFYGRYVAGAGADDREPLATTWSVPYTSGRTELVAWRDTGLRQNPFVCGTTPNPYPLAQTEVVVFDSRSDPLTTTFPPLPDNPCVEDGFGMCRSIVPLPHAAQRIPVDGGFLATDSYLGVPFKLGWAQLNLNTVVVGTPWADVDIKQSWVMALRSGVGRFSTGVAATQLDNARTPNREFVEPLRRGEAWKPVPRNAEEARP